jgi:hypothetical protein
MNAKGYLGIALAMAMMSENSMHDNSEKPREFIPREEKEPKQPKGHLHYWFRSDGTFIKRITKEECLNLNVYLSVFL